MNSQPWQDKLDKEFGAPNDTDTVQVNLLLERLKPFITKEITEEVLRAVERNNRLKTEMDKVSEYFLKIVEKSVELCLTDILAKAEGMDTAREVRHLIKDYIPYGKSQDEK